MMRLILTSAACGSLHKFDGVLKKGMKVAFISTAAEPYADKYFVEWDRQKLISRGLEVIDYDIKPKNEKSLLSDLKSFDVIFVCGGNTFYLLEKMQSSGFDKVIKQLLITGIIYVGSSAGSVVTGQDIDYVKSIDDPALAKNLKSTKGLGLTSFVILPHVDNEKYLLKTQKIMNDYKDKIKIIPVKDGEGVLVEDEKYTSL